MDYGVWGQGLRSGGGCRAKGWGVGLMGVKGQGK